jgi:hypothetical protein
LSCDVTCVPIQMISFVLPLLFTWDIMSCLLQK